MKELSMLEQEVLPILNQLEFCCDRAELCNKGKEKSLEITCDDLRVFYVDGNPNFYLVVKYIQKNGIDFTVTFDIEDSPNNYMDKEHPGWEYIQLGIIKDKDINTIKEKIIKLKNKLNGIDKKEWIKPNHQIEIRKGGQIFIDGNFSEVELTPKISNLLKKLILLDKNGDYPQVKTKGLENKKKRNNDTLRTTLARLRKDTKELFEIKNVKNENDESCYTIIFKD